ncbi:MAG: HlyC/CorC family transporter [Gammaproteobacteria bacterium]|nr:HlyC/CorC family transporter [Gammaproteobacteria bacterium]
MIILSAFFSGSETSLLSLNRYRLRHLSKIKHTGAMRAEKLLQRPDRLIGLILLGNNFVNILASSISTLIAMRLLGEAGIAIGAGVLTFLILIFAEVTPKTLAALHPERFAFPASYFLSPLLWLTYPFVWVINLFTNSLLKMLGVDPNESGTQHLTAEELRTVVNEAGALIPRRHQKMLLSILDLEKVTVEDIMVPRNEIFSVDLDDDWEDIHKQLTSSAHTRIPACRDGIDNLVGLIHIKRVLPLLTQGTLDKETLESHLREPYFVPEGSPLNQQLLNFQRQKRRIGFVVNEYGDIQGLVTLEDILEEIVGEFTTDPASNIREIHPQNDGTFLVDGSVNIRELNRAMHWELPTEGPKTLNGLVLEYLETIPEPGTSLLLAGYPIDIVQTTANSVKMVRINPAMRKKQEQEETRPE